MSQSYVIVANNILMSYIILKATSIKITVSECCSDIQFIFSFGVRALFCEHGLQLFWDELCKMHVGDFYVIRGYL